MEPGPQDCEEGCRLVGEQGELYPQERSLPRLPHGAEVDYFPRAVAPEVADRLFAELQDQVAWEQDVIRMFGKVTPLPRLTAWYGDPGRSYTYSGIAMAPRAWIPPLDEARSVADRLAGVAFNSVLCNLYRHGNDKLAWHSDDEPELGPTPVIASVNLGAERKFLLRSKDDHNDKVEIPLGHGDVLVMRGRTQQLCEHTVPPMKGVDAPRINLTFRRIEG